MLAQAVNWRKCLQFSSVMLAAVSLHVFAFWYLLSQETVITMTRRAQPAAPIEVFLLPPSPPPTPVSAPTTPESAIAPETIAPPEPAPVAPPLALINSNSPAKFTITAKKAVKSPQKIQKMEKIAPKTPPLKISEKPKLSPAPRQKIVETANNTPVPSQSAAETITTSSPPMQTSAVVEKNAPPAPVKKSPPRFDAAYLHNPTPDYPVLSKKLHEEGTVYLKVKVNAAGRAEQVLIENSSGFERLDQAGQKVVQQWQFIPAREGDTPISAWVIVPIAFILR